MRTRFFVSLLSLLAFASGWTQAQTEDPAKVAEYQKRFEQGYALQQQGKLAEARAIYDGILAEEPKAKRSLLEAGRISLKLNDPAKADDYLEKLHALVPDLPEGIELLIQADQALKRDAEVELLIKEFHDLHDSGKIPEFTQSPDFVREQIHLDSGNTLVITEYFNYTQGPYIVWKAQILDVSEKVQRQLVLIYDPRATQALREKDPKLANAEQFLLVEDVLEAGQVRRIDAYFQMFAMPEYKKVRNTMLAIIGGTFKPVYSQAVDASAP